MREFEGFDEQEGVGDEIPIALVARVSTNKQGTGYSKGEQDSDLARQVARLEQWAQENHPGAAFKDGTYFVGEKDGKLFLLAPAPVEK